MAVVTTGMANEPHTLSLMGTAVDKIMHVSNHLSSMHENHTIIPIVTPSASSNRYYLASEPGLAASASGKRRHDTDEDDDLEHGEYLVCHNDKIGGLFDIAGAGGVSQPRGAAC